MPDEFKVVYLNEVQVTATDIREQARKAGMEKQFLNAIRSIEQQLRTQPREFGDPTGTLPGLKLDVFRRAVAPLIVYYGVHQVKRIVFVNKIRVLPFSGF